MWRFLRHTTRLLRHQGYYKAITSRYIKVITSRWRWTITDCFQNRPTLDAKKMHFCSSESRESRIFEISALKTIVLKNKTKLFSTCNWSIPGWRCEPFFLWCFDWYWHYKCDISLVKKMGNRCRQNSSLYKFVISKRKIVSLRRSSIDPYFMWMKIDIPPQHVYLLLYGSHLDKNI